MATELAKAYIQIVPSMRGTTKAIENELNKGGISAGNKAGKSITGAIVNKFKSSKLGQTLSDSFNNSAIKGFADKMKDAYAHTETLRKGLAKIGSIAKTGFKTAGVAVAAVTVAVGKLAAESIKAYGQFEQLEGGAKKIFNEMDYSVIAQDAQKAWKDLNLSANDYLSMINTVGATFAATMNDQEAYDTARKGMQAISDYASGTGEDIQTLNEKFKLITRATSQYVTISDQFSGILPATSADFLKQAQAAGFLSEKYTELTQVPVAEYQKAIADMLELGAAKQGFAGNTAAETTETLTGSIAGLKATWENLKVAFVGGGDEMGIALDDFTGQLGSFLDLIVPKLLETVPHIGQAVVEMTPKILEMFRSVLEMMKNDKQQIIDTIVTIVTLLIETALDMLPDLLELGIDLMIGLADGLLNEESLKSLADAMFTCLQKIIDVILDKVDDIWDCGKKIIEGFWNGIKDKQGWLRQKISGFFDGVKQSIKDFFGIHSPSRWAKDAVGAMIPAGMAKGITENSSVITDAFSDVLNFTPDEMTFTRTIRTVMDSASGFDSFGNADSMTLSATSDTNRIISEIQRLNELLLKLKIVLNDGTLVGKISGGIDENLGGVAMMKARGI